MFALSRCLVYKQCFIAIAVIDRVNVLAVQVIIVARKSGWVGNIEGRAVYGFRVEYVIFKHIVQVKTIVVERINVPYLHRVVVHIMVVIVLVHIDAIVFYTDPVVNYGSFIARCGLAVIEIDAITHIRGIDCIVFYHICTVTVIKVDTFIKHIAAFDCIPPDRHSIKIFSIDAAIGVGDGIAADFQPRGWTAGVITV